MNPLTSIKFVFVCKALAWRAYLTIFPLHQHNNIKRNPRMRWWVIDTHLIVLSCRSVLLSKSGFCHHLFFVTVGRIGGSSCLCGTGVGVHLCWGFPSVLFFEFSISPRFIRRRSRQVHDAMPKSFRFPRTRHGVVYPKALFSPFFDNIRGCSLFPDFNVPSACHRSW